MKTYVDVLRRKPYLSGGAVVVVLIILFLAIRSGQEKEFVLVKRGEFVEQISVSGTVSARERADLGLSQSGRISGVYVKVGDVVPRGAILAEMENADLYASLEAAQAELRSLEEGTRPEEIAVSEATVEKNKSALEQARRATVEAVWDAYVVADNAVHNTVDQFVSNGRTSYPVLNVPVYNSQLSTNFKNLRISTESSLKEWGELVSLNQDPVYLASKSQEYLFGISSFLAATGATLNAAVPSGSITQTIIDGYVDDVATARASVQSSISDLTTKITSEKNAAAALKNAELSLELDKAGTTKAKLDVQRAKVNAAAAELAKTLIRAPFSGVVTVVNGRVGEIFGASKTAISMLNPDTFQIESYIPEINIASLKVGGEARVYLDAYGEEVLFKARVASIDPAETVRDGVSTYRAVLEFTEQDDRVRAGMTASVTVTTGKRDLVLSVPQGVVVNRDGKKFVKVLSEEGIKEKEVQTGAVSYLGELEIISGLEEEEKVFIGEK